MIHIVQWGPRKEPAEGLRLGTVRCPPRGVPKENYAKLGMYDVFFPTLAPTAWLLKQYPTIEWEHFRHWFIGEMKLPHPHHVLNAFAELSHESNIAKRGQIITDALGRIQAGTTDGDRIRTVLPTLVQERNFSIGCYCNTEDGCHRSILRELLDQRGAKLAPAPKIRKRRAH
jgi:uncharacterized protein YeaO (DUF488 family)